MPHLSALGMSGFLYRVCGQITLGVQLVTMDVRLLQYINALKVTSGGLLKYVHQVPFSNEQISFI